MTPSDTGETFAKRFRVEPGAKLDLAAIDPDTRAPHESKESAREEIARHAARLRELQYLLYAEGRRALLICLQALDAGGKDGVIRHVLGAMNPQGCEVHAFKVPTDEEASHDFLWRAHRVTPPRGAVSIFNRSYYEDVLVTRVHGVIPKHVCEARYEMINDFERALAAADTHVLKFYLHISKDEQLERFRRRLEDPQRWWKISEADYAERAHWDAYRRAYEDAISACSTTSAPWFIIPANHKWFRDLAISAIVVEHLEGLKLRAPEPTVDIETIRRRYHSIAGS